MTPPIYHLENRRVFTLSGSDRLTFLQGLITKDVTRLANGEALYTALLTPQGKYLYDFFLYAAGDLLYLEVESDRAPELLRKLMMYKLRSAVEITDSGPDISALSSDVPLENTLACARDPRLADMGYRALVKNLPEGCVSPGSGEYRRKRLALGIAEGAEDFIVDKSLALEGNLEDLNGVDFNKGCYVGQEVTARSKHRGKVRRRFVPVRITGPLPDPDTPLLNDDGLEIGQLRSGQDDRAMAYVKLDKITFGHSYRCGEVTVTPWQPDWMTDWNKGEGDD